MDYIPHRMNQKPAGHASTSRASRAWTVVLLAVVLFLLLGHRLVDFWVDLRWFEEVGYTENFWTIFRTQWGLGVAFAALFLVIAVPNIRLALRLLPSPAIPVDLRGQMEMIARRSLGPILYGGAIALAVMAGAAAFSQYDSFLKFRAAVPFHTADPLFHNDIGYYVFQLPFQSFVVGFLLATVILTLLAIGFTYAVAAAQYYDPTRGWPLAGRRVPPQAARHISLLVAAGLLLKAVSYWLQRYDLLYHSSDIVSAGAGYADVHARLPVLYLLMVLSVAAAIVWIVQLFAKKLLWGPTSLVALVVVSFLGGITYPGIVEQIHVKPNEFTAEEPYIGYNIEASRKAYGLDGVAVSSFPIRNDPSPGLIQRNSGTIANARLWDYSIAVQAYRQLQEIKPYYQFLSVDVDRYRLNGKYRQVLIAAREMDPDLLPDQAKSFQNLHLVYTHGFGACISPVNEVSADSQPTFFMKGIPPTTNTDLRLTQPRVYFGESDMDWSVVGTTSSELDYPGTPDVYRSYDGKAGIPVGGALSRTALAFYLSDQNFLLSNFISPRSRLLIHRKISDRIRMVAPFLSLYGDAYPVIADGRIVWLQDAYTTTNRYPYSEAWRDLNYIRNSVKIAVDAYDGTINFYIADSTDPILQAYARIFPHMFRPMKDMPASLRSHIRYPEDLFNIQSTMYLKYHMTDPRTFFTKEDVWDLPKSAKGVLGDSARSSMEAYYVIMRLPGEKRQEMVMIRPFTPHERNNMIVWMAARCDEADYGRIIAYRFPIENLPLGPSQMDASILQKPEISKELTLLNQEGSQVVLGNMLTIPLESSLLYVQPLYVQSKNQGNSRAELARVIVAYGDRVEMSDSLNGALNTIFGSSASGAAPAMAAQPGKMPSDSGTRALVQRAATAWDRAQAAQKEGNWAAYGTALKELDGALKELERATQ